MRVNKTTNAVWYLFEKVNNEWIRWYLLNNEKRIFIGAESPAYIQKNLLNYLSEWSKGATWILSLSETNNSIYGEIINNDETEISIQDQETQNIFRKRLRKDDLIDIVNKIKG